MKFNAVLMTLDQNTKIRLVVTMYGICWSWKKAQRNKDQIPGRDGEIRQLNSLRVYGKSVV